MPQLCFITCNTETWHRLLLYSTLCSRQRRPLAELSQDKCRRDSRCWLCRTRAVPATASGFSPEGRRSQSRFCSQHLGKVPALLWEQRDPTSLPVTLQTTPELLPAFWGRSGRSQAPPPLPVASSKRGSRFLHRPKESVDVSHEDSFAFKDLPANAGLFCKGRSSTVVQTSK